MTGHLEQAPLPGQPPDELSPKELTAQLRKLATQQLEHHQQLRELHSFVHEKRVVPELDELDEWRESATETLAELTKQVQGATQALATAVGANSEQLVAIAKHLGVPVVGGLSE